MAIADLTVTAARSTAVDFTYPFWIEPSRVAVRVCVTLASLQEMFTHVLLHWADEKAIDKMSWCFSARIDDKRFLVKFQRTCSEN